MKPENIILEGVPLRNVSKSENTKDVVISFSDFMWFIGFFEGEGTVGYNVARKNLSISVPSTDYENVLKCKEILGWGNIQGPYSRPNRKDFWYWSIGSGPAAVKILEQMYQYLSPRRKHQIVNAINKYHVRVDMRKKENRVR